MIPTMSNNASPGRQFPGSMTPKSMRGTQRIHLEFGLRVHSAPPSSAFAPNASWTQGVGLSAVERRTREAHPPLWRHAKRWVFRHEIQILRCRIDLVIKRTSRELGDLVEVTFDPFRSERKNNMSIADNMDVPLQPLNLRAAIGANRDDVQSPETFRFMDESRPVGCVFD